MGMFDYIYLDVSCPVCGNFIDHDFQTKDFERLLDTYKPGDNVGTKNRLRAIRVYTSCAHKYEIEKIDGGLVFTKNTGTWIEYEIPIIDGIIAQDQNLWKRHHEPVEWNGLGCVPDGMTTQEFLVKLEKRNERMKEDIRVTKHLKKC